MRFIVAVFVPMLFQLIGFAGVIFASIGGGSFVGLLALSAGVIAVPGVLIVNWVRAYSKPLQPVARLLPLALFLALVVPALLLLLRLAEPHI